MRKVLPVIFGCCFALACGSSDADPWSVAEAQSEEPGGPTDESVEMTEIRAVETRSTAISRLSVEATFHKGPCIALVFVGSRQHPESQVVIESEYDWSGPAALIVWDECSVGPYGTLDPETDFERSEDVAGWITIGEDEISLDITVRTSTSEYRITSDDVVIGLR